MSEQTPLTASSTIAQWLDSEVGGPLIRGFLAGSGGSEDSLAPVRGLPLQQLVALSQGQLPQSVIDDLVRQANDGVIPESVETGWVEKTTPSAPGTFSIRSRKMSAYSEG